MYQKKEKKWYFEDLADYLIAVWKVVGEETKSYKKKNRGEELDSQLTRAA